MSGGVDLAGTMSVARNVFDIIIGAGLPSAAVWYFRDRVKSQAAARVAEATVSAEIQTKDTAALETHIAYVERAFELERTSMSRQVGDLNNEVAHLRELVVEKDKSIVALTAQVAALTAQMQELHRRIDGGSRQGDNP